MTSTTDQPATFAEWVIIEQLGHRRLAGLLTEEQIAGAGYLRLDVPATDGAVASTHYLAHSSIYAIHPVDEETARALAARCRPEPVRRYELPAAEPQTTALELDLIRLAEHIGNNRCDHDRHAAPDPRCAGCIARSVQVLTERHGLIDDDPAGQDGARDYDNEPADDRADYDDEGPF